MKKLIDDAKEKAQEAKEQAANKAQEALVEATIGVAKRKAGDMVTDLLEGALRVGARVGEVAPEFPDLVKRSQTNKNRKKQYSNQRNTLS